MSVVELTLWYLFGFCSLNDSCTAKQLPASYFREARGMTWHTTDYSAGDLVIFDSRIIHATSRNYCDAFRLSLDFRWYIAPERDNFGSTPHSEFVLACTQPITGGESGQETGTIK